tara:strand:+ start:459 stop:1292 length:834 start_codon:yes stop_codon:yes gene_type:complete
MSDLMFTNDGNQEFLNDEQIRKACPVAFSEKASNEVSKHYTHIPTNRVIDDMRELGWGVIQAQQVAARKNATKGYQKHMIVFRHPDLMVEGQDGDNVWPQIIMTNSHDGKNSFTFQAGMYRLVCSNGLVIADQEFGSMKIRHMGYDFDTLRETINEMVEKLPLTVESMNKFKNTELTKPQKYDLARKALATRFKLQKDQKVDQVYKIDLDEFLKPVRKEDAGDDLWSVFNLVQEKVVEGDFEYISGVRLRKARKIKNFKQDLDVNQKLFEVAKEFAA